MVARRIGRDCENGVTTIAWISDFPIEWLPELPDALRGLPRPHPATWMSVLLGELDRLPDYRLHILALRKRLADDVQFERNGVQFHVLKVPPGTRAPSLFWMDTWRLGGRLRQIRPDLVHAWGSERGASIVAARLPFPWLMTVQGLQTWYREVVPLSWHYKLAGWIERIALRRAPAVTAESSFAVEFLRRRHPSLNIHQIEHAPNRIFHRLSRRPQLQPVRFLTVGTPGFRKGTDLLLRALTQLVGEFDFELVSAGVPSEDFLAPLKKELPATLWKSVHFLSDMTPAEVAAELAQATILVLPTRADTSPNAVKEAVVAGVPVVASNIGGIPDYVVPGKNGLLFPSENLTALIAALREAIRHPLFRVGGVESATLAAAREQLSPATMASKFLNVYRAVLSEAAKSRSP